MQSALPHFSSCGKHACREYDPCMLIVHSMTSLIHRAVCVLNSWPTKNKAENYLYGSFPLFAYLGSNYQFTHESEREAIQNALTTSLLGHSLVGGPRMYPVHLASNAGFDRSIRLPKIDFFGFKRVHSAYRDSSCLTRK